MLVLRVSLAGCVSRSGSAWVRRYGEPGALLVKEKRRGWIDEFGQLWFSN